MARILVKTVLAGGSKDPIRVQALPDQDPFLDSYYVSCSRGFRSQYPIGTIFELDCQPMTRAHQGMFIYCHYTNGYKVIEILEKQL
jgi:hypothetical protein